MNKEIFLEGNVFGCCPHNNGGYIIVDDKNNGIKEGNIIKEDLKKIREIFPDIDNAYRRSGLKIPIKAIYSLKDEIPYLTIKEIGV